MLVLSRKTDESIIIDGRIEVTVVQIEGGRVRLGITAPREVSIRRSELAPRHEAERDGRVGSEKVDSETTVLAGH